MSKFNMKDYPLDKETLSKLSKNYKDDKKNDVIRHALSKSKLLDIIYVNETNNEIENKFSIDIKTMRVCNQKQSGRCWIFAGLNILREIIGEKLNVEFFFFF